MHDQRTCPIQLLLHRPEEERSCPASQKKEKKRMTGHPRQHLPSLGRGAEPVCVRRSCMDSHQAHLRLLPEAGQELGILCAHRLWPLS